MKDTKLIVIIISVVLLVSFLIGTSLFVSHVANKREAPPPKPQVDQVQTSSTDPPLPWNKQIPPQPPVASVSINQEQNKSTQIAPSNAPPPPPPTYADGTNVPCKPLSCNDETIQSQVLRFYKEQTGKEFTESVDDVPHFHEKIGERECQYGFSGMLPRSDKQNINAKHIRMKDTDGLPDYSDIISITFSPVPSTKGECTWMPLTVKNTQRKMYPFNTR